MSTIAIIPARGGSKRLPRKNILPLEGVPLVVRVINTCISSGLFDKVIVSSEDTEILDIVSYTDAIAFKRNIDLAQDRSTVVEVCLDVLEQEKTTDSFCCIYATSALLSSNTLKEAYSYFLSEPKASTVMGVSKYNHSPVQALLIDENGFAKMLHPEYNKVQSQLFPKLRVSNGSFYWSKFSDFAKEKTFYTETLKVFDIPDLESCDLDNESDYIRMINLFFKNK